MEEIFRDHCFVCNGTGKLFIRQRLGDLKTFKEVPCSCWCCKGRGFIEHNIPKDHRSKYSKLHDLEE